jgi:hypothetical protein
VVTTFVQQMVAPQVVVVETMFAAADQQMLGYGAIHAGTGDLIAALARQASVVRQSGLAFSSLEPPPTERQAMLQIMRLLEDLAVCSDQVAMLLEETAAVGFLQQRGQTAGALEFGPRMRRAVSILRRAEGWLETIDHETSARIRLPGFGEGQSLDEQLHLPPV